MTSRLPLKSKTNKNRLSKRAFILLASIAISCISYFFASKLFFQGASQESNISIAEFYTYKTGDKPGLYLMLRNDAAQKTQVSGELYLEDKVNRIKKRVLLGSLGVLEAGEEKSYQLDWDESWQGTGFGEIKIVVVNDKDLVSEKSVYLAVVPQDVTSLSMFSLVASGLLGAGFIASKFV